MSGWNTAHRRVASFALTSALAGLVALGAGGCATDGVGPDDLLSISALTLPSPAIFLNDTLRDSLGRAARLRVQAFDSKGGEITGLDQRFVVIDTTGSVTVTREGYVIAGATVPATAPRIVASVGGLQTQPVTLEVSHPPELLERSGFAPGPIGYLIPGAATYTSSPLAVRAGRREGTTFVGSRGIRVRFEILRPASAITDTVPGYLIGERNLRSTVDTTDQSGVASRSILIRPSTITATTDTVFVVRASAPFVYRGVPRSLGTVEFTLPLRRTQP